MVKKVIDTLGCSKLNIDLPSRYEIMHLSSRSGVFFFRGGDECCDRRVDQPGLEFLTRLGISLTRPASFQCEKKEIKEGNGFSPF